MLFAQWQRTTGNRSYFSLSVYKYILKAIHSYIYIYKLYTYIRIIIINECVSFVLQTFVPFYETSIFYYVANTIIILFSALLTIGFYTSEHCEVDGGVAWKKFPRFTPDGIRQIGILEFWGGRGSHTLWQLETTLVGICFLTWHEHIPSHFTYSVLSMKIVFLLQWLKWTIFKIIIGIL